MAIPRYRILDAYTLEELKRNYESSDTQGRIRLLETLYADHELAPFEVAALAVQDSHVEVRQWIARNGKFLDFNRGEEENNPDRNLENTLENDPDTFVRACLRENPNVARRLVSSGWVESFQECTHLERLALVRNPSADHAKELIEKIFDPEDKELCINLKEREELAWAFLTNKETLTSLRNSWYTGDEFLTKLWRFSRKWPKQTKIEPAIYRYVPADDKTKAVRFRNCDEPVWRRVILENSTSEDKKTIKLGMKDSDDDCRSLAYSKVNTLEPNDLKAVLEGSDLYALEGLGDNRSLAVYDAALQRVHSVSRGMLWELGSDIWGRQDIREKLYDRLRELDESGIYLESAIHFYNRTYEEVEKKLPSDDPDQLFSEEARNGNSLERKVDFIGQRLTSYENRLTATISTIKKLVLFVAVIWVGWKLLEWFFRTFQITGL